MKRYDILRAMPEHGGISGVKRKMGIGGAQHGKKWGWKRLKKEIRKEAAENKRYPTANQMNAKLKRFDIMRQARRFGGYSKVVETLRGKPPKNRFGKRSLSIWANMKQRLGEASEELGHFPKYSELKQKKYNDIRGVVEYNSKYRKTKNKYWLCRAVEEEIPMQRHEELKIKSTLESIGIKADLSDLNEINGVKKAVVRTKMNPVKKSDAYRLLDRRANRIIRFATKFFNLNENERGLLRAPAQIKSAPATPMGKVFM